MNILIKNVNLLQVRPKATILKNMFVGIEEDIIKFISKDIPNDFVYSYEIDGKHKLLMPGMTNAHTHIPMSLLKGVGSDKVLMDWLYNHVFPAEKNLSDDHIYLGSLLSCAELIMSGTTSLNDMYFNATYSAKGVYDSGLRGSIGVSIMGDDFGAIKKDIDFVYNNYNNLDNGRVQVKIAPHAMYTCSNEFLIDSLNYANRLGVGIHTHIAETRDEVDFAHDKFGVTPVKYFYDLGYFNSQVVAAHCIHINDDDIEILASNKVICAHNPSSNLKLGSGISPVPKLIEKGAIVTIGTDGSASNNNINMFEEMHLTSLIHKGYGMNPTVLNTSDTIKLSTYNGRHIFNMDIGDVAEGYKADLILIDLRKPHLYPDIDTISNIVYSAQGSDVDTVIVDGKILMEKRELKTIDIEKLYYDIDKLDSLIK
jgi:5-methylthioadenosine/S-adenosylhomocysteine deaminase